MTPSIRERTVRTIGGNDPMIAAHAVTLRCALVTDNVPELLRIESPAVENRLQEPSMHANFRCHQVVENKAENV